MSETYVELPAEEALLLRYAIPTLGWASQLPPDLPEPLLRDLYRGTLVWGAVGDALGRPAEGRSPDQITARFGPNGLRRYEPWRGYTSGRIGTITDDTQLTMLVAESLVDNDGLLVPRDLVARLIAWLPIARGIGRATRQVVSDMAAGDPWWRASAKADSAGNGAAMRAAPVGLLHALDPTPDLLTRDAVQSAIVTHTHPVGVAATVVISAAVAWCVRARMGGSGHVDPVAFTQFIASTLAGLEPTPTPERKPDGRAVTMRERVAELPALLSWNDPQEVFSYTHNGAFALESVPAALYVFLRWTDDPSEGLVQAVNAGYDADSVASMAGNLFGAFHGLESLQTADSEWYGDLEYREALVRLADALLVLAFRRSSEDIRIGAVKG